MNCGATLVSAVMCEAESEFIFFLEILPFSSLCQINCFSCLKVKVKIILCESSKIHNNNRLQISSNVHVIYRLITKGWTSSLSTNGPKSNLYITGILLDNWFIIFIK